VHALEMNANGGQDGRREWHTTILVPFAGTNENLPPFDIQVFYSD
jgi:hypothetical protein